MDQNNNELYHYGVPGMRWGHRKAAIRTEYKTRIKKADGDYDKTVQAKADYKKAKNALKNEKAAAEEKYYSTPEGQKALKRRKALGKLGTATALIAIGDLTWRAVAPKLVDIGIMQFVGSTAKYIREG